MQIRLKVFSFFNHHSPISNCRVEVYDLWSCWVFVFNLLLCSPVAWWWCNGDTGSFDQSAEPDRSACTRTWVGDIQNMVGVSPVRHWKLLKSFQIDNSSINASSIVRELINHTRDEEYLFGGDILEISKFLKRCLSTEFFFFWYPPFSALVKSLLVKRWRMKMISQTTCTRCWTRLCSPRSAGMRYLKIPEEYFKDISKNL